MHICLKWGSDQGALKVVLNGGRGPRGLDPPPGKFKFFKFTVNYPLENLVGGGGGRPQAPVTFYRTIDSIDRRGKKTQIDYPIIHEKSNGLFDGKNTIKNE